MAILDKIKLWIVNSFVSNLLRRLISYAAAALTTAGILTQTEATTWEEITVKAAIAVVLICLDLLWSYFEKRTIQRALPIK
jgi:hypothetical protein